MKCTSAFQTDNPCGDVYANNLVVNLAAVFINCG